MKNCLEKFYRERERSRNDSWRRIEDQRGKISDRKY